MAMIGPLTPSQGLNTSTNVFTLPVNQAIILDHFRVTKNTLETLGAPVIVNAGGSIPATVCYGLASWVDPAQQLSSFNSPLIVWVGQNGASAKKIYTGIFSGGTAGTVTFADKTGAIALTAQSFFGYRFASLNGMLVGVGTSFYFDAPFKITGYTANAVSLGGAPPSGDAVTVVNNFMFLGRCLGGTSIYSRVYWSNVGDPETWGASNYVDFRKNDGDIVTALSSIGQDLIIFKKRSIGRLSTSTLSVSGAVTLGPLTTISESIGCVGPHAVDHLPDGRIIFLDTNNRLRILDGVTITDVGDQILPAPSIQNRLSEKYDFVDDNSVVITYPAKNLVMIDTGVLASLSTSYQYFYDYVENTFCRALYEPSDRSILTRRWCLSPSTQNNADVLSSHLMTGTNDGNLYQIVLANGAKDITGANISGTMEMSIPLPEGFVPRSILIPLFYTGGASPALNVWVGFNGSTLEAQTTTLQGSSSPQYWYVIDVRSRATARPRPQTMQVEIKFGPGAFCQVYPFYISDEVIR